MKKRAVNPAHALALCYAGMVCLAIAVNLMPIFLTTIRVDLGGKAVLTDEQLGRISALTFAGLVGGILFTGPLADRWGGKLFSILGTLLIGVGLVLLGISPTYSMVLVAVFVMGLDAGILDMVLSPIVAALQPDSRAKALNWLHSFYGIGTVITVLVGTFAFRLGIGWRTTSLTLITVPLLVALGFVTQRQGAAVRMFLSLFGLGILAFEVGECYVQRLVPEAEVQQNTCKGRSSAWDLVSFRRTGEEP